jgi:hypothetical protein
MVLIAVTIIYEDEHIATFSISESTFKTLAMCM